MAWKPLKSQNKAPVPQSKGTVEVQEVKIWWKEILLSKFLRSLYRSFCLLKKYYKCSLVGCHFFLETNGQKCESERDLEDTNTCKQYVKCFLWFKKSFIDTSHTFCLLSCVY